MSCFDIPIELEIEILERLPVETLVTLTAVCKSWYSIVKNPHMLKRYHSSSIIDPEQEGHALLMSRELRNDSEIDCVVISQDSFVVRNTFAFTFTSKLENVGSCCNGVVCLSEYESIRDRKELYLFNPSIRKLRPVSSSSSSIEDRIKDSELVDRFVGFGYDEIADDYKVVKFYHIPVRIWATSIANNSYYVKFEAEVYSLRSGTWKTVVVGDHPYHLLGRSVSVNNATHWLCNEYDGRFRALIVAFDFSSDTFREIALPHDVTHVKFLGLYKGSLAILKIKQSKEDDESEESESESDDESEESEEEKEMSTVSLWIMKEYGMKESWSKEFTVVINSSSIDVISFTKNGKLIFWKQDSELVIWDPETEQAIDLIGFSDEDYSVVEDYLESLVLI